MGVNDWQKVKTDRKMVLGRYIVADPKVCHGKLTFRDGQGIPDLMHNSRNKLAQSGLLVRLRQPLTHKSKLVLGSLTLFDFAMQPRIVDRNTDVGAHVMQEFLLVCIQRAPAIQQLQNANK